MTSFRNRVTLACALGLFGLSLILGLASFAYLGIQTARAARHEVRELAERLAEHLGELPAGVEIADHLASTDAALSLLYDPDKLNFSYQISQEDQVVYTFTRLERSPFADLGKAPERFLVRRQSYKDWTFYYGIRDSRHAVVVASTHHYDIIDHLLLGLLIELPVALALSVLLGIWISRRVLVPLEAISRTAASIEQGDLDARIANPASGDEVEALVRTLNRTFAELQTSFRRIEQFSADAAHELRTPLTAIRGNLEVCLRKEREPEEYQESMAVAVEEIARLNLIIDQLLMMARNPDQIAQDDFEIVDLGELVRTSCTQCEILAESANLRLLTEIAEDVQISGSPALLGQLCYNLLQNAIKFSEPGGAIYVTLTAEGVLTVRDEGIGIAPEHLESVFERFYQVSPGRGQGSGLGLSMVRWIADLHHGTVALQSTEGAGAKVTVALRLSRSL